MELSKRRGSEGLTQSAFCLKCPTEPDPYWLHICWLNILWWSHLFFFFLKRAATYGATSVKPHSDLIIRTTWAASPLKLSLLAEPQALVTAGSSFCPHSSNSWRCSARSQLVRATVSQLEHADGCSSASQFGFTKTDASCYEAACFKSLVKRIWSRLRASSSAPQVVIDVILHISLQEKHHEGLHRGEQKKIWIHIISNPSFFFLWSL